jgi:hypothetical protein
MKRTITALLLLAAICLNLCACGAGSVQAGADPAQNASAKSTEKLIKKIGTVTADSEEAVKAAEAAYNSLSEEEKHEVENAQELFAARSALDSALRVRKVESLIDAACNPETGDIYRIDEVKAEFDALPAEEQALVVNSAMLQTAMEEKNRLEQEELQQQILGRWNCAFVEKDVIHVEDIVTGHVGESSRNISDYLTSSDLTIHAKMDFNQDGTYTFILDEEKTAEEINKVLEAVDRYYSDTLRVAIAGNLAGSYGIGIDPFYDYAWEWGFGMSFEAMAEQNLKRPLEDVLQELNEKVRPAIEEAVRAVDLSSGRFRLGEGRLYLAPDSVSDSAYVVFERTDDTIVLAESVQEQIFTPARIPATLTRENG